MQSYHHYINGKIVESQSKRTLPVLNPALGKAIAEVKLANKEEVDAAVAAARAAFANWSATSLVKRARVLFNFKILLEQNIDALALQLSHEHGKIVADAKGEVLRGIELVEMLCGIPSLLKGEFSANVSNGIDCYTMRQPLGVCVGVTPFNFPIMISIWQFASAIACGNTFVVKPSEKDPGVVLKLAELMQQAGLPNGVLNVVNGDKTAVDALLHHPDVVAITCVGSTPVAEYIYKTAIDQGKRAHCFGGAKNHAILMPDADFEQAANAILGAAFGAAGERCMALPVVVAVGDATADRLVNYLIEKLPNLKIGKGDEPDVEMGPLISKEHLERVQSYVDLGVKEKATLVIDGRDLKVKDYPHGFFMGPCVFDHVTPRMRIYQEEIFGPVLCIVRVATFAEALDLINQHLFGNGTAVFTQHGGIAREFAERVRVGMVGINIPIPVPISYHSFGGWKASVFGDLGMHGMESIRFYTRPKSVTVTWPTGDLHDAFAMPTH